MKRCLCLALAAAVVSAAGVAHAGVIDLGGPATGYLAISNFKNSTSQEGIEGASNGLPDYPNFQIPATQTNAGRWTAVIASPQFSGADYSPLYSYGGVNPGDVTVNNLVTTDANHATMSAGEIEFSDSLLTGVGTETIPVSALTFNFDTYQWNGHTANGWNTGVGTINISPFSTVHTAYNDGGGAGNAAGFFNISLSNVTGSGLTFQDGALTSMDFSGDLSVLMRIGNFPTFGSATFAGSLTATGLTYKFDVDETKSVAVFSGIHMIMNREGTASQPVPEPSCVALLGLAVSVGAAGARRSGVRS